MFSKAFSRIGLSKRGQRGVAIIGFALVSGLLFAVVFMILAVGRLFYVEGLVKASLNETLRVAEGDIDLWVREPGGADAQSFEHALQAMNYRHQSGSPTAVAGISLKTMKMRLPRGGEMPMKFAFLPPGYCAVVEDVEEDVVVNKTVCNSHICGDPAKAPGNCQATVCNIAANRTEEVACSAVQHLSGYSWGSCEKDQVTGAPLKSLCAKKDDGKSYHHLLRNYPVELRASFDVPTPIGKIRRDVLVAGYPRIMVKEQVSAVPPPPACPGSWVPSNSCVTPPGCGHQTGTGVLTYSCSTGNAADCWCVPRPANHGTQTTCSADNPYTGSWVLDSNWSACVFPNAGNTPASCQGTQTLDYRCSVPNCCDPGQPKPPAQVGRCSRPGGTWVSSFGSCFPNSGNCGPGTQTEIYSCPNPPCCNPHAQERSISCDIPCCQPWSYADSCPANIPCDGRASHMRTYFCASGNCCGAKPADYSLNDNGCAGPVCPTNCYPCSEIPPVCGSAPASAVCVNGTKTWTATGSWSCTAPSPSISCPPGPDPTTQCSENCQTPQCVYKFQKLNHSGDDYVVRTSGAMPACLANVINNQCNLQTFLNRCSDPNHAGGFYCGHAGYPEHCGYCHLQEAVNFSTCVFQAFGLSLGGDTQTMYVDNACTVYTSVPPGASECGGYEIETMSPISLVWNGKEKLEGEPSLVKFAVNPEQTGSLFTWWGSSDYPLLVHDPKHLGKIESATQLFGNHTFGGKKKDKGTQSLWTNGFEALASLDRNKDDILKGPELKELGLWFDDNRDGLSQAGEVKSLEQAGVQALYWSEVKSVDGVYTIAKGFDRLVDGKVVSGAAVDWFSTAGSSVQDLPQSTSLRPFDAQGKIESPTLKYALAEKPKTNVGETSGTDWVQLGLDGVWEWSVDGSLPDNGMSGMFIIREQQGQISGASVTQNLSGLTSASHLNKIVAASLSGGVKKKEDGSRTLEFSVKLKPSSGGEVLSSALVLPDGVTMIGQSRQAGRSVGGRDLVMDYTWTARRRVN